MASVLPDEGLDLILTCVPIGNANAAPIQTQKLRLFSNFTAATVGTRSQTYSAYTESAWTNYAAQTLTGSTWGALADDATGTGGRKTTYPQVTFPTCGASGGTVNGFYISNPSATFITIAAANFDDTTAVVMASGDVIKVTPTLGLRSSP